MASQNGRTILTDNGTPFRKFGYIVVKNSFTLFFMQRNRLLMFGNLQQDILHCT